MDNKDTAVSTVGRHKCTVADNKGLERLVPDTVADTSDKRTRAERTLQGSTVVRNTGGCKTLWKGTLNFEEALLEFYRNFGCC